MATIRLTTLGDSFVEGRGDAAPGGGWHGWVPRLAEMLWLPGDSVRNLGTFQATTQDVVDHQLTRALTNKAPVIGVIVGVNDLVGDYDPDRFRRNLTAIFEKTTGMDTAVFTATYADIPANLPVPETFRTLLRDRFARANDALRDTTARTGALCLDVTTVPEWADPAMWSPDGLHPSPRGHEWFARSVAELLASTTGMSLAAA
ncbi:SGNH/GDSL hydrolase family protein [Nocardia uniformis]|uniref:SGNH/GDSL hydrolase family protein n=1 Tax=Nocardia uniformis TaxID=53432 RepID=A0A849BNR5_9NOCA|nr:SGNH/GDSL hydrolase family protein [Nocardia uniformis]NNH68352.1 SGNH/GDSL hydrolase family protein [Nocardia uniformis]